MRKYWIITAIARGSVRSKFLSSPPRRCLLWKSQAKDILVRLEKVEAQEERIEALERQVAKLLALSDEPPEIPSEGVVEMTEGQYRRWFDEEILRISLLVPEWEAALESDDVDKIFSTLFGLLDTGFGFYDAHSRIVTPDPSYEETQSELTCYMDLLEPFRRPGKRNLYGGYVLFYSHCRGL